MQMNDENNSFQANYTIQVQGKLIDFSTTKVMGIVNLTLDSFYSGSRFQQEEVVLSQVEKMLEEGADFIDLGAFSSRPGAEMITEEEERKRLLPALQSIAKEFPTCCISVDTYRSEIAKAAVNEGASVINDISAGSFDPKMFNTIAELKVPYIIMHMQGEPKTMQNKPNYKNVVNEVYYFFSEKLKQLTELKVNDVILDVGFGFGKSLTHNYSLLKNLNFFQQLERPMLIGLSRKGMIQKVIDTDAAGALNGTTAAHVLALMGGATILRVHDVKEAKQAVDIVNFYQKQ
ncbi:MAG: dihydropteroate synthase [Vicingaceae bacterium]